LVTANFNKSAKTGKQMMDIVYIRELEIRTIIGIFDWERDQRQVVSLDLELGTDIREAAATDSIEKALDYKAVSKRLIDFVENSEFFLVETLAERIADILLKEFKVPWLKLRVGKPGAVTGSKDVGVVIIRGEKSQQL
jgi:dihydroneopterin aldolase|tara:strand:+ start:314 stop:727 length:414 start_codon:yes stop_codon:yes gene_type:complete